MRKWIQRSWRRAVPGAIIGLATAIAASAALLFAAASLEPLQLTMADTVFIRDGGPLLGAREPDPSIVLVLWDDASRQEYAGSAKASLEQDLALYQVLLADRPLVVADTVAVFWGTPGLQELVEGMVATGAGHTLLRDLVAEPEPWYTARAEFYVPHVAHNLLNDASLDSTQYLRYYPLIGYYGIAGESEAMALQVARARLGAADAPFGPAYVQSGIMARWYLETGNDVTDRVRATADHPVAYEIAPGRGIPWVWRDSPTDRNVVSPSAMWINYAGPPGRYRRVSYADVLNHRTPPGLFTDKTVIVGVDNLFTYPVPGSTTARATEAEVVAQAAQTIVDGRFMQPLPPAQGVAAIAVLSLVCALLIALLRPLQSVLAILGMLALYVAYTTVLYRLGTFPDLVAAPMALVGAAALAGGYRYGREEITRRHIYDMFGRYVARAVVAELVERHSSDALSIGGVSRDISVLFADIRGFTAFSEQFTAEEVVERLNTLLKVMVDCAFRYEGTVDKFIGDAIMVIFNAPLTQPDHGLRAVKAALDMQRSSATLEGGLAFGVGIHTGKAVVGTVGTIERMEYTAIGSTVNIASRLCDTAGKGEVVISEELYAELEGQIVAQRRSPIHVKNVERELVTYLVTGLVEMETDGSRQ
ncbi:MAG: adenylate cyclase [Chloroflexota bacterium]|jgi:adenylate cyclase|nr:adenylate cyclase [Chloroflexota bacterium]